MHNHINLNNIPVIFQFLSNFWRPWLTTRKKIEQKAKFYRSLATFAVNHKQSAWTTTKNIQVDGQLHDSMCFCIDSLFQSQVFKTCRQTKQSKNSALIGQRETRTAQTQIANSDRFWHRLLQRNLRGSVRKQGMFRRRLHVMYLCCGKTYSETKIKQGIKATLKIVKPYTILICQDIYTSVILKYYN